MLLKEDKLTIDDLLDSSSMREKNVISKREHLGKLLDKQVLSQPRGPKRWRAAVNLWLNLGNMYVTEGMTAKEENDAVIQQNRLKREILKDKYGFMSDVKAIHRGGGNSDMREALCMPFGAHFFINLIDPETKTEENTRKLMKEFKEYTVPEAY